MIDMPAGCAISLGLILGVVVASFWKFLSRWCTDRSFWNSVAATSRTLLTAQPQEFFRHYQNLLQSLAIYLVKTGAHVAGTMIPIVLVTLPLSSYLHSMQFRRATYLEIFPPQKVTVRTGGRDFVSKSIGRAKLSGDELSAVISGEDWQLSVDSLRIPQGTSESPFQRVLMMVCGLHLISDNATLPPLLVVRPSNGDNNYFWPYLSDLEFLFWGALASGSLGTGIVCSVVAKIRQTKKSRKRPIESNRFGESHVPSSLAVADYHENSSI